jgi:hypothetical protein
MEQVNAGELAPEQAHSLLGALASLGANRAAGEIERRARAMEADMRSLLKRLEALEVEQEIDLERLAFYRCMSGDPNLPWHPSMNTPYGHLLREIHDKIILKDK